MSIMVGTGRGAEAGVLFRNAEALELLEQITTLVVDKTGTLTEGKPRLVTVAPQPPSRRGHVAAPGRESRKRQRASARGSDRRRRARARHLTLVAGAAVRVDDGQRGHRAVSRGARWRLGICGTSRSSRIDPGPLRARAEELRLGGQTVMFVVVDGAAAGLVGVADPVKPTTREAIDALHRERREGRDADRRQPHDGARRSRRRSESTRSKPMCCPIRKRRS